MKRRYCEVSAELCAVHERTITVHACSWKAERRIKRSLIHPADDARLDRRPLDREVTFRMDASKAEEIGLA